MTALTKRVQSIHNPAKYVKVMMTTEASVTKVPKVLTKVLTKVQNVPKIPKANIHSDLLLCSKSVLPVSAVYCFEVPEREKFVRLSTDQQELFKCEKTTIVKYGMSKDLARRAREHHKTYGVDCTLLFYAAVHPSRLREAERDVRSLFKSAGWQVLGIGGHRELACVPASRLKRTVIPLYRKIGTKYGQGLVGRD
jgi:hypothetical protein